MGCVISASSSAALFADQFLHQRNDVDVACQVRRFVEGIVAGFAFGGAQMHEANARGDALHDGLTRSLSGRAPSEPEQKVMPLDCSGSLIEQEFEVFQVLAMRGNPSRDRGGSSG
jgi:hypothetical protein